MRTVTILGLLLLSVVTSGEARGENLVLRNPAIRLELDSSAGGVPRIAAARWSADEAVLFEAAGFPELDAWLPPSLVAGVTSQPVTWREVTSKNFLRAEATRSVGQGVEATWIVELTRNDSLFRVQCRLTNRSGQPVSIERFPIFVGGWRIPGGKGQVRWWDALSFQAHEEPLGEQPRRLESRCHSSDVRPIRGVNPYWMLPGERGRLMFCLNWCGGWQADLQQRDGVYQTTVALPPEETQLVLKPGESIDGPALQVFATRATEDRTARAEWLSARARLGRQLHGGPEPAFPFIWNHWYTVHFDVTEDYLRRQVAALEPYGFDYFVVDAGWYDGCGRWVPNAKKFPNGSFEAILKEAHQKGPRLGIWTCPQFLQADAAHLPEAVDRPGFYEKFIDGHLLDLAGGDFRRQLLEHVAMLRQRYHVDWWKYDQVFFAPQTRQGLMRNVLAFQEALQAVREAQPDLYFENCQSGGRMINEFTVQIAQGQWLRDGGKTGRKHAEGNFSDALGALEFLPPATAARWLNRPDENDPNDDEFTRMYCRSCMVGTWGLVADLGKIADHQREVILREVEHYRRLNACKGSCRYDLYRFKSDSKPFAGVVFYSADGRKAGIILARTQEGPFEAVLPLTGLGEGGKYRVEDVDQSGSTTQPATALRGEGLHVAFPEKRLSAVVFVDSEGGP